MSEKQPFQAARELLLAAFSLRGWKKSVVRQLLGKFGGRIEGYGTKEERDVFTVAIAKEDSPPQVWLLLIHPQGVAYQPLHRGFVEARIRLGPEEPGYIPKYSDGFDEVRIKHIKGDQGQYEGRIVFYKNEGAWIKTVLQVGAHGRIYRQDEKYPMSHPLEEPRGSKR